MNDISFIEKIGMLMKLISSSSLFLICMLISILILGFLVICTILNKKVNKWVFISVSVVAGLLLLINYGRLLINILDIILDSIFMALYFPNLPIYILVVIIVNIVFFISIFSKRQIKANKIADIISSILMDFILVLIIEVVRRNGIDIYEEINLYTNSILLVSLQLSMGIFVSWILARLFISAHLKLKKYDEKEYPAMQEIIFEEVEE